MPGTYRFLFTTFECGGHVGPAMVVARRLAALGHQVLFVSDVATAPMAEREGLAFRAWRSAPNRTQLGDAAQDLRDWTTRWPPAIVATLCRDVMTGPALRYAQDTLEFLRDYRPDVVISNELLLGVMAATEAQSVPLALLTANAWCYPTRSDIPPFGPGFGPAAAPVGPWRDRAVRRLIGRFYDAGLPDLNRARIHLGLAPLSHVLGQLGAAHRVILGVSQAFDYGLPSPPPGFDYAGPLIETPTWARDALAPSFVEGRDRVLVSFGTTYQNQKPAIANCIRALARLDVEGIVTLGPAVTPAGLPSAANVTVLQSASHDALVPTCKAVICHGGHGTVLRPLMFGVPVLCLPMGRDHPENAARIAFRGAGLTLSARSSPGRIAGAVGRLLAEPQWSQAARALGAEIEAEADGGAKAAEILERLAATRFKAGRLRSAPAAVGLADAARPFRGTGGAALHSGPPA